MGVPVVPLVSITRCPACGGFGRRVWGVPVISSSRVGTAPPSIAARSSTQARYRSTSAGRAAARAVNSWSNTTAETPSRALTSPNWVPANPVFISTTLAPSLPAAIIASSSPRWSRHSTAIIDSAVMPRRANAVARRVARRSISPKVNVPSSSTIPGLLGCRRAAT